MTATVVAGGWETVGERGREVLAQGGTEMVVGEWAGEERVGQERARVVMARGGLEGCESRVRCYNNNLSN